MDHTFRTLLLTRMNSGVGAAVKVTEENRFDPNLTEHALSPTYHVNVQVIYTGRAATGSQFRGHRLHLPR